jgi:hypothetical protein
MKSLSRICIALLLALTVLAGRTSAVMPVGIATLELMGQMGGATSAVAVQGGLAVIGEGPRLLTLDVSGPAPELRGEVALPDLLRDVALSGAYAVAGLGAHGLHVYDVHDPSHPYEVGSCAVTGSAGQVRVAGAYAYVAAGAGGLRVFDLSVPGQPHEIGAYQPSWGTVAVQDILLQGSTAYLVTSDGLRIVDISEPANPRLVGLLYGLYGATGVYVHGQYAYLPVSATIEYYQYETRLAVIDISDPADPRSLFYIPEFAVGRADNWRASGGPGDISGAGAYVYLGNSGQLVVLDISDPRNVTQVASIGASGRRIVLAGTTAYLAAGPGLQRVDLADPLHPRDLAGFRRLSYVDPVAVVGGYAYVNGGKLIVDVRRPATPVLVGNGIPGGGGAMAVAGALACVLAYPNEAGQLRTFDVTDPTQPRLLGACATGNGARCVRIAGRYAYVLSRSQGLQVIDLSDSAHPRTVANITADSQTEPWDVAIAGQYAYVAWASSGQLFIFDVSDPVHPRQVGACTTHEFPVGVAVAGHYAYVADRDGGLAVIDVADPTQPNIVRFYIPPDFADAVAVSGRYLYLVSGGLHVLDLADPADPREVAAWEGPAGYRAPVMAGTFIYVADASGGLSILRWGPQRLHLPMGLKRG